jgi:chromosome segregation ATPase
MDKNFQMPTDDEIAQFAAEWSISNLTRKHMSEATFAEHVASHKRLLFANFKDYLSAAQIAQVAINRFFGSLQNEVKKLYQQVESKTEDCRLYLDTIAQVAKSAEVLQKDIDELRASIGKLQTEKEALKEAMSEFITASDNAAASQHENDGQCDPKLAQRVREWRVKLEALGIKSNV